MLVGIDYRVWKVANLVLFSLVVVSRIFSSLYNPEFTKSMPFAVFFVISLLIGVLAFSSEYDKYRKDNVKDFSRKSIVLSVLSLLCVVSFSFESLRYFTSNAPSDNKIQYFFMGLFCMLSAVCFLFVSYSHIVGKNAFGRYFQFLVFAPELMYLVSLMLFFSMDSEQPDVYNVLAHSAILMFYIYYPHNFIRFSENRKRRMYVSGLLSTLVLTAYAVPTIVIGIPTLVKFHVSIFQPGMLLLLVNNLYIAFLLLGGGNVKSGKIIERGEV